MDSEFSVLSLPSVSKPWDLPPQAGPPSSSSETTDFLVYQRRAIGISMREACPAKMANEDAKATKRHDQVEVTVTWFSRRAGGKVSTSTGTSRDKSSHPAIVAIAG